MLGSPSKKALSGGEGVAVSVTVVGASGRIARQRHLAGALIPLREAGLVDRIVLAGRSPELLRETARSLDIAETDCVTVEESLRSGRPDVALVATPSDTHADLGRAFLEQGKHVFLEKPVAMSPSLAWSLVQLARASKVSATMAMDKAFSTGFRALRGALEPAGSADVLAVAGEFGYFVDSGTDWRRPAQRPSWNYRTGSGGSLSADLFTHWSYMLEIIGQPHSVQALAATRVIIRCGEDGREYVPDVPDWMHVSGTLDGGIPFSINSSWVRRPAVPFRMAVHRSGDSLVAEVPMLTRFQESGFVSEVGDDVTATFLAGVQVDEFRAQWEHFITRIIAGEPDVTGLEAGARAADFVDAIDRSVASGTLTPVRKDRPQ